MPSDSIAEVADSIKDEDTNLSSTPSGAPINTLIDTPSELCDQATASSNLKQAVVVLDTLMDCVKQQVLGRDNVIELAIIALIADGHVLLEDFPGSGKTTLAKALGEAIVSENTNSDEFILPFRRIQFTPDLLPSDVTGVPVFDSNSNAFHFRHGPIFAHVVLADEINRTSPKVQSAMLEAMGEKQVTVDNETYPLDSLFFVIATQNPLDLIGTYPLPTPQLDRFLFKVTMDHIDRDAELDVLATYKERRDQTNVKKITVNRDDVLAARKIIDKEVVISTAVQTALVDISRNLRDDDRVLQGNSTRSMVLSLPALQACAALRHRSYVSAEDIELLLPRVLGHRIELAPGVSDFDKILAENMHAPMEVLARGTLG
jgi:MoxR-like ATPase